MTYIPKYQRNDSVRIPVKNPGHDNHDPKKYYIIAKVYRGSTPEDTSYLLKGLTGIYPETRIKG